MSHAYLHELRAALSLAAQLAGDEAAMLALERTSVRLAFAGAEMADAVLPALGAGDL